MNSPDKKICATCGKPERLEMDARQASEESGIALKHYLFCPTCYHCLCQREDKALRERSEGREMTARVYAGEKPLRLRIQPGDIQELVFYYGFDVIERIEAMTPEALEEVERLYTLEYIETRFKENDQGASYRAWRDSLAITEEQMAEPVAAT